MLVPVALCLPQDDYIFLKNMHEQWFKFKVYREEGRFENGPDTGFITMLQREKMLDSVFERLGFGA